MKNLEKFNAETTPLGTQLITRDGREVTEWYYFKTAENNYPVRAVVKGDFSSFSSFTKDGQYDSNIEEHPKDLFIKPKVREIWKNVYKSSDGKLRTGADFFSKEEAIQCKQYYIEGYLKTIRITDEPE